MSYVATSSYGDYKKSSEYLSKIHVLNFDIILELEPLEPNIEFECILAGFSDKVLEHGIKMLKYFISSNKAADNDIQVRAGYL